MRKLVVGRLLGGNYCVQLSHLCFQVDPLLPVSWSQLTLTGDLTAQEVRLDGDVVRLLVRLHIHSALVCSTLAVIRYFEDVGEDRFLRENSKDLCETDVAKVSASSQGEVFQLLRLLLNDDVVLNRTKSFLRYLR
jgi:hypothetical protein